MDVVTEGLLDIYQQLLHLKFHLIKDGHTWHPEVALYEVTDADTGKRHWGLAYNRERFADRFLPLRGPKTRQNGTRIAGYCAECSDQSLKDYYFS